MGPDSLDATIDSGSKRRRQAGRYSNKSGTVFNLLRDDLGMARTHPT